MNQETSDNPHKRVVYAPQPDDPSIPASVISVLLNEDEEVEWQWMHRSHGRSVVTGYQIIKRPPAEPEQTAA